ncbi:STAS domain-containing protein [Kitasatospora sp. NPDC006697]|uniref:STAS domain-containing protein n=1 Tax=Kitasatospora sp. NPDC006697 TaxID=3364020 RepID=UPI0036B677CA
MPTQNDHGTARSVAVPPADGLTVELSYPRERTAVCLLAGELDVETLAPAEEALEQLVAAGPQVLVVDLERVGFCDSSGLNLLLKARLAATAAGSDFRVAAPSPMVRRVLELTGANTVLSLHESTEAALAATA